MKKVTKRLLVACVAALAVGACQDSVTVVEPPPAPPPPPPPPGTLPSIQIQQITNVTGAVINPAAAAGQINFVLNVEPGDGNTLQEVRVLLDGAVVGRQTFSANRAPKGDGVSFSSAPTEIIVPFDTRGKNANGDRYGNTTHTATAEMTHSGGTASAASLELTFKNLNVPGSISFSGNNAADASGDTWYGNDDVVATCEGNIFYDTAPADLYMETHVSGMEWDNGDDEIDAPATQTGDREVSASATAPLADNGGVEDVDDVDCELPGTATGWDLDGDGLFDCGDNSCGGTDVPPGSTYTLDKTLRLDNKAPAAPAGNSAGTGTNTGYTFADGRNTAAINDNPVNNWGNASTVPGMSGALLDSGIGTVTFAIHEAVPVAGGFGTPASWDVGAEVAALGDLGESANTTDFFRLIVQDLADGLGNTTSATAQAPGTVCDPCSNTIRTDLTAPVISNVRPDGIAILRPEDGTNAGLTIDLIADFDVQDALSGLDANATGVSVGAFKTAVDVDDSGANACSFPTGAAGCTYTAVTDATTAQVTFEVVLVGSGSNAALEDSYTVDIQWVDEGGNVATDNTAFTTDITSPLLTWAAGSPPQGQFDATGAQSLPVNFAGAAEAAAGTTETIGQATITGYTGPRTGTACTGTIFQDAISNPPLGDADARVRDLGSGPAPLAFSTGFTLFTQGVGVTTAYCYEVRLLDSSLWIDGTMAGNPSQTATSHTVIW